jgi:hypothetical protein
MSEEIPISISYVGNEHQAEAGRRVIGFVHGLRGDPVDTWTNKETRAYWPSIVKSDPAFGGADIFVVGYKSGLKGTEPALADIVSSLRRELLDRQQILRYGAISFVAHSLGGMLLRWLLTDDALQFDKTLWRKTRLLMSYSSPYLGCTGAQIAGIGILADSVQLDDVKVNSPKVQWLDQRWNQAREGKGRFPMIKCAWENAAKGGDWFMDRESSIHGCDEGCVEIHENHFNVVKPDGPGHASHLALRAAYQAAFSGA